MVEKIAVTVMCFDRPHYLRQVIDSFEQADGAMELDWYFFQDGAINEISGRLYANVEGRDEVADIIRECNLPVKGFYRQMFNVGPGQQRFNMYRLLNTYELMYVFDDDMVVGQHYFRLLKILAEQFPDKTGLLYTNDTRKVTKSARHAVREQEIARLWGHYMWRHNWEKFRDDHKIYADFIKDYDFMEIRQKRSRGDLVLPTGVPTFSDDIIVNKLCRKHGIKKITPRISRAKYIGREGVITYKTDNLWKKRGMQHQREQITFEEDTEIEEFILR